MALCREGITYLEDRDLFLHLLSHYLLVAHDQETLNIQARLRGNAQGLSRVKSRILSEWSTDDAWKGSLCPSVVAPYHL